MIEKTTRYPIDLCGEVRTVEPNPDGGGCFTLLLENGRLIHGDFTERHRPAVVDAMLSHSLLFKMKGEGEFGPDGELQRISRIDAYCLEAGVNSQDPAEPPLLDILLEIAHSIPEAELAKIPADFSGNIDHYLYGGSKRGAE